jgi:hypothetical protein
MPASVGLVVAPVVSPFVLLLPVATAVLLSLAAAHSLATALRSGHHQRHPSPKPNPHYFRKLRRLSNASSSARPLSSLAPQLRGTEQKARSPRRDQA